MALSVCEDSSQRLQASPPVETAVLDHTRPHQVGVALESARREGIGNVRSMSQVSL